MGRSLKTGIGLAVAIGSIALAGAATAQMPFKRVQGKVASVVGDMLTVDSADGPVTVQLAADWRVQIVAKTTAAAIKPGSFIGTTNVDVPGGGRATEVHVFPPGVKMGEGQRVMTPGTQMTNGTVQPSTLMTNGGVDKVTGSGTALQIDVSFPGGTRHVQVPPDAMITEMTLGDRSAVAPGATVTVAAQAGPDGKLITHMVSTGPGGSVPPR